MAPTPRICIPEVSPWITIYVSESIIYFIVLRKTLNLPRLVFFKTGAEKQSNIKLIAVWFCFVFVIEPITGFTSPSTSNSLLLHPFKNNNKYIEIITPKELFLQQRFNVYNSCMFTVNVVCMIIDQIIQRQLAFSTIGAFFIFPFSSNTFVLEK